MAYSVWRYKMKHIYCNLLFITLVCVFVNISSLFSQERQPAAQLQGTPVIVRDLNSQQEAEVLKYLEEYYPERVDQLSRIKESRSDTYREQLLRAYTQMIFLNSLKESDPEQYQQVVEERNLEAESNNLATQYKNMTNISEKEKIKTELETLLNKLFDYRQRNRIVEIERLEERLANLKEENQNRLDNKDEIVKDRLYELLGEKSGLEW